MIIDSKNDRQQFWYKLPIDFIIEKITFIFDVEFLL